MLGFGTDARLVAEVAGDAVVEHRQHEGFDARVRPALGTQADLPGQDAEIGAVT